MNPSTVRASRWIAIAAAALLTAAPLVGAGAQGNPTPAPAAPASPYAKLQGFVVDSIHNAPLTKAVVLVEGTSLNAITDADGHYVLDSIPPGAHRVQLLHAMLDTIGFPMQTNPIEFKAGETKTLDLSIPSAQRLSGAICSQAMRMRGPAAMMGFVRDPDTKGPAIGAKVELVYQVTDVIGRKSPVVRSDVVDSSGLYHICGLPADMSGKVQVFRNGVSSGEVPAEVTNGFLALRGFSVAGTQTVVEVKNDSGKVRKIVIGTARVVGRIVNSKGEPLKDARIILEGQGRTAISQPNGHFELDSLPSGTQSIEVRRLGYSVAEVPVELSSNQATTANVKMSDAVPMLAAMRVEAAADNALSKVGYLQRKQTGMGYFMDGKMINHEAMSFSDVMRAAPGLRVSPTGDGRTYVITDSRSASNGCVNFVVDGTPWQTMEAGDIDQYVRPDELVAVEVYHGSETPAQYTTPGQSSCATIVAWTQAKISTLTKKK